MYSRKSYGVGTAYDANVVLFVRSGSSGWEMEVVGLRLSYLLEGVAGRGGAGHLAAGVVGCLVGKPGWE